MKQAAALQANPPPCGSIKTFFSKPHNVILLLMGIVLTITTVAPIIAIVQDTFKITPAPLMLTWPAPPRATPWSITPTCSPARWPRPTCGPPAEYRSAFGRLLHRGHSVRRCVRVPHYAHQSFLPQILKLHLYLPYIMPQWTLAVVWQNLLTPMPLPAPAMVCSPLYSMSRCPCGGARGSSPSDRSGHALCALCLYPHRRHLPQYGCEPGGSRHHPGYPQVENHVPHHPAHGKARHPLHHSAGIQRSMGSYPVPHYLGLATLSTKYVSMNSKYTGEASILAIIMMMLFGVAIMLLNQRSLKSRKNYTTVTGKSGQISKDQPGTHRSRGHRRHHLSSSPSSPASSPSFPSRSRPSCPTPAITASCTPAMPIT